MGARPVARASRNGCPSRRLSQTAAFLASTTPEALGAWDEVASEMERGVPAPRAGTGTHDAFVHALFPNGELGSHLWYPATDASPLAREAQLGAHRCHCFALGGGVRSAGGSLNSPVCPSRTPSWGRKGQPVPILLRTLACAMNQLQVTRADRPERG